MPEPQKPSEIRDTAAKIVEARKLLPIGDAQRAGSLRLFLITFFAFLNSFKDRYRITMEFGGGHFVDVTAYPLMRVRVVWKNGETIGGEK